MSNFEFNGQWMTHSAGATRLMIDRLDADATAKSHAIETVDLAEQTAKLLLWAISSIKATEVQSDIDVSQQISQITAAFASIDQSFETMRALPDDTLQLIAADRSLVNKLHDLQDAFALKWGDPEVRVELDAQRGKVADFFARSDVLLSALDQTVAIKETAREAANSAIRSAAKASRATGAAADDVLAKHFDKFSKDELKAARLYRAATFILACAAGGVGGLLYFSEPDGGVELGDHIARGLIVLAVAGISTYCGRLAAQHRRDANWAATISLQLLTFEAFLDPVASDAARDAIFVAFSGRVLGAPPQSNDTSSPMPSDQLLTALLERQR